MCYLYLSQKHWGKVVERRNVHFLTPAVFQAQDYVLSVAAFVWQRQSWVVSTETTQPTMLKIFPIRPFIGKACQALLKVTFFLFYIRWTELHRGQLTCTNHKSSKRQSEDFIWVRPGSKAQSFSTACSKTCYYYI